MKQILGKILSISMAMVVLLSTFSFSVSKHYCLNRLVETSFIVDAKGCMPDEMIKDTCEAFVEKKSCCDDIHIVVEGLEDFHFEDYTQPDFDFEYDALSQFFTDDFLFVPEKNKTLYFSYKPPPLYKSIYQFNETYLI